MSRISIFGDKKDVVSFYLLDNTVGFSFKDQKDIQAVRKNRQKAFKSLNMGLASSVFCQQVHGDNVHIVATDDIGKGSNDYESGISKTDAMITNLPNVFLAILVADCVPVLYFDPLHKVVGVAHAGWRGTMLNIAGKTVRKMVDEFGTNQKDILVSIGPSIGPDCFEVGKEVIVTAKENVLENFLIYKQEKTYFDLWNANREQLLLSGVSSENIKISGICTHCSEDYFSFRRDKDTRRFIAGIMLKDNS